MYRKFFKRVIDIVCSFFGLLILIIPMIVIGIIVRCDSDGPALFKTERVGKDKKNFMFYKFRSMSTNAPKDVAPRLIKSENYITKVGKVLRKTSLDEIPQLWCILKGDMSIVGPRPSGLSEIDLVELREETGANSIRPGLTGWAQVNGRDVLARDIKAKAALDGEYANDITFVNDMKIIFTTVKQVLCGKGVVEGDSVFAGKSIANMQTADGVVMSDMAEAVVADIVIDESEDGVIVDSPLVAVTMEESVIDNADDIKIEVVHADAHAVEDDSKKISNEEIRRAMKNVITDIVPQSDNKQVG